MKLLKAEKDNLLLQKKKHRKLTATTGITRKKWQPQGSFTQKCPCGFHLWSAVIRNICPLLCQIFPFYQKIWFVPVFLF